MPAFPAPRANATPANDQYATPALGIGGNAALLGSFGHFRWEAGGDLRVDSGESRELFSFSVPLDDFTMKRRSGGKMTIGGLYGEGAYDDGDWLLTLGVRIPRYQAALIDGAVMTLGAIYVVFFTTSFIGQFQGFLITLGVPIAAWCGIMLADIALRRRNYAEPELFTTRGRYGDIRWLPVLTVVVATALGWGLVTNGLASWLTWQGYLLGPFGLGGKTGAWAFANLGVLIALALGFVVTIVFSRSTVRAEEAAPVPAPATV